MGKRCPNSGGMFMQTNVEINYKRLGESIKRKRKKTGLTQEEIAEKVNLSPTHISNIETGKTKVSLQALIAICNVLNCLVDELLLESVDESRYIYELKFHEYLKSCTASELKIILDVVCVLKTSLKQNII